MIQQVTEHYKELSDWFRQGYWRIFWLCPQTSRKYSSVSSIINNLNYGLSTPAPPWNHSARTSITSSRDWISCKSRLSMDHLQSTGYLDSTSDSHSWQVLSKNTLESSINLLIHYNSNILWLMNQGIKRFQKTACRWMLYLWVIFRRCEVG